MNNPQSNRGNNNPSGMQNDTSKQAGQSGSGSDKNQRSDQQGSQSGSKFDTDDRRNASQQGSDSKIGSQQDRDGKSTSNAPGRSGSSGH